MWGWTSTRIRSKSRQRTWGGGVRHVDRFGEDLSALDAALARLRCPVAGMRVVYEAGPCGYAIYRHPAARGIACAVVAPSLTPRRPGERIKTDRLEPYQRLS